MSNPRIIFGTSSSQIYKDENTNDLVLFNSNQAGLIVDGDSANVGIGKLASSTHKLDIEGSVGVGGSIVPSVDDTFELGTTASRFSNLYAEQGLYLGSVEATNDNGVLDINSNVRVEALSVSSGMEVSGNFAVDTDTFFVDASTDKVGINNSTPETSLHISGTDGLVLPVGDITQRKDIMGAIRYNSQTQQFEGYKGTWGSLGGVMDVDQNTYITAEDSPIDDNNQLKFFTEGDQRMIVNADGSVGIGVSSSGTYKLEVDGDIGVSGNFIPKINESFDLGSTSNRFKDLYLGGDSIFIGDSVVKDVSGVFTVTGAAQMKELNITDNANITGELNVSGAVDFKNNLAVFGNTDLTGELDVSGVATLHEAVTMKKNLSVIGDADFDGTLDVLGQAQLGSLNVSGAADVDGTLDVAEAVTMHKTLDVAGTAQLNALNVTGNMSAVGEKFNIYSNHVYGNSEEFIVLGATEATIGHFDIHQENATIGLNNTTNSGVSEIKFATTGIDTLRVGVDSSHNVAYLEETRGNKFVIRTNNTDRMTFDTNNNVRIGTAKTTSNKLSIQGNVNLDHGGKYKIDNVEVLKANQLGLGVTSSNIQELGTLNSLTVTGTSTLNDAVTMNSTLTVVGDADLDGTLDVSGEAKLGSLYVTGDADIDGNLDVSGTLTMNYLNVTHDVAIGGDLDVSGDAEILGGVTADTLAANSGKINGTFDISGDFRVNTDVLVVDSVVPDSTRGRIGINTGTTGPRYELDLVGSANISENLIIGGNLTVEGTTTTVNTEIVTIEDPLISLAANNQGDTLDSGFYSKYVQGGVTQWTGLYRDQTDGDYKLFTGSQAEPTQRVDDQATGYTLADLHLNQINVSTVEASTAVNAQSLTVSANADLNTLDVAGIAQLNSLNVTGNTDIDGTLDVAGTVQLNALNVTGYADIDGTLDVANAVTMQSTLVVASDVDFSSALDVSGIGTFHSDLSVELDTTLKGDLRVNTNTLVVDSSLSRVGINTGTTGPLYDLDVGGSIQAQSDMIVQGDLIIHGASGASTGLNGIWIENVNGAAYTLKNQVGIGVSLPNYELDVVGDINLTGDIYKNGSVLDLGSNAWTANGTDIYYNAGQVGIGITNPDKGYLQIEGEYGSNTLTQDSYSNLTADTLESGPATASIGYSIYASGKISASAFHAVSDKRVKQIVDLRNNEEDKLAIENLNIYDYKYIDSLRYGNKTKIGVMAQDLELISSDIIDESEKFIPNVFAEYKLEGLNKVNVGEDLDIEVGDLLQVQYKLNNNYKMIEKSVISYENGILELSECEQDEDFHAEDYIFIYGKQINDFKSVNFEQLTALNTSALKGVIEENKSLKAELKAIKEFIGME